MLKHNLPVAMSEFIQILTTTETAEDAEKIGQALVERRLAACVQIAGPITSIYRWKGKIERAQEFQCWIKTRQTLWGPILAVLKDLHPYEVPEVLAIPILDGDNHYLSWLHNSVEIPPPPK
jgi:periplasmic divalent cation tolerance protein